MLSRPKRRPNKEAVPLGDAADDEVLAEVIVDDDGAELEAPPAEVLV